MWGFFISGDSWSRHSCETLVDNRMIFEQPGVNQKNIGRQAYDRGKVCQPMFHQCTIQILVQFFLSTNVYSRRNLFRC